MEGRSLQCPFCKRVVKIVAVGDGGWEIEVHSMHPIETFVKSLIGPVHSSPVTLTCVLSYAPVDAK